MQLLEGLHQICSHAFYQDYAVHVHACDKPAKGLHTNTMLASCKCIGETPRKSLCLRGRSMAMPLSERALECLRTWGQRAVCLQPTQIPIACGRKAGYWCGGNILASNSSIVIWGYLGGTLTPQCSAQCSTAATRWWLKHRPRQLLPRIYEVRMVERASEALI